MKKKMTFVHASIVLGMTLLWTQFSFAQQQGFCEDFNQFSTTTPVGNNCTATFDSGMLDNWGGHNIQGISYRDNQSQNGSGDYYLYLDDGSCGNGATFAFNDVDYTGNWIEMSGEGDGCFCFDLRAFHIQVGTITGYNSLRIYDGPNPGSSTLSATFVLSAPIDVSLGWVRTCAPVELSDAAGNLPGNAEGQWVVNTGSASDWDTLISNVGSVVFSVDVGSGDERWGIDNICLSQNCDGTVVTEPEPTNEGAYCCDEQENLVQNGNFEFGDNAFTSDYTQDSATVPGQYDVTNSAVNFNATVTDHSFCEDPTMYANNDMYLLINGRTTQPTGTTSIIWEQTMQVEPEKAYKFCANFKNMAQCTFDILPEIRLEINGFLYNWETINTSTDPCDWQLISECLTLNDNQDIVNVKIHLKEDGLGDGNDLAIDDISLQQKLDQNLSLTVQNQGNPLQITGSVNSIDVADDMILTSDDCLDENDGNQYYWFVYELLSYPFNGPVDFVNMAPNSFSWSSNLGGYSSQLPASANPVWGLTTTFPNYTFENNKLYVIGMYVPSCCDSCYDEAWSYQVTLSRLSSNQEFNVFTPKVKHYIKSLFTQFDNPLDTKAIDNVNTFSIYPNPAETKLYIKANESIVSYRVIDITGKVLLSREEETLEIDVSELRKNMYFLELTSQSGKRETIKFLKQ